MSEGRADTRRSRAGEGVCYTLRAMIATARLATDMPINRPCRLGALRLAREVLEIEADAVRALIARLDERFLDALRTDPRVQAAASW